MKNQIILIILFSLLLISCNKNNNKTEDSNSVTAKKNSDSLVNNQQTQNSDQSSAHDPAMSESEFVVHFPEGSKELTLKGNIIGFGDNKTYVFEAKEGQTLNASVYPDEKNGNVRISQIIFPSGKADGPFDNTINYNLTESGNWKLIISENQMSGDPWKGDFTLKIKIK